MLECAFRWPEDPFGPYTLSAVGPPGHLPHGLSYREGRREMVVKSFKLTDIVKVRILFDTSPI